MSQKVPTRRERKKQQTRTALLDSAMALFAEKGIYGTRIEDITERVDLGKGAFYNYFASKEALVAEAIAQGVEQFEREYLSRLNGAGKTSERIVELAGLHAAFLEERPRYAVLFHQARGLLLIKDARVGKLHEIFATYLGLIGHALVAESDSESWSEETLLDVAAALVGSLAGYRSYRAAAKLSDYDRTAQDLLTRALPGLLEERRQTT